MALLAGSGGSRCADRIADRATRHSAGDAAGAAAALAGARAIVGHVTARVGTRQAVALRIVRVATRAAFVAAVALLRVGGALGLDLEALERFDRGHEALRQFLDVDLVAGQLLDVLQERLLLAVAIGDGDPVGTGARGPPDAVDILFGDVGQIVIDDVADARDVDPARGDIGRDQDRHAAVAEGVERLFTLRLALVAMDRARRDAGSGELAHDLVGSMLGAAEDERALDLLPGLEEQRQERGLLGLVDEGDALLDPLDGGRDGRDGNFGRVGQIFVGKALDRLRHGRREEQGLALGRDDLHDPLQGMDEAEVEHLVGLVEDEDLEAAKIDRALLDQVEQATGGGDEDVEAAADGAQALGIGDAAEDHADGGLELGAVSLGIGGNLRGELTRGSEHQHPDLAGAQIGRTLGGEPLQRGEHEGGGLAGTRLGDAEQVAPGQHVRDRLRLDRGGDGVILGCEGSEQGRGKPERVEIDGHESSKHTHRPVQMHSRGWGRQSTPRDVECFYNREPRRGPGPKPPITPLNCVSLKVL